MDSACCSLKSVINRIKIQRVCLHDDDNGDDDDDDDDDDHYHYQPHSHGCHQYLSVKAGGGNEDGERKHEINPGQHPGKGEHGGDDGDDHGEHGVDDDGGSQS